MALCFIRFLSLLLTLITGASALVYEVTWQYYLANLLGSQARSTALILATFLGGLAIGYHLFGRLSQGRAAAWLVRMCGVLEAAIGGWALAFPFLYELVWKMQKQAGYQLIPVSLVGDLLSASILLVVPTALMGASLPLLTQGLSRGREDAPGLHAKIYVVNTLGAFLGALTAGFFLLPTYGLSTTMRYAGVVNVVVGFVLVGISFALRGSRASEVRALEPAEVSTAPEELLPASRLWFLTLVAFLGGLISITTQSVLVRVIALSIGASVYAFTLVVSAFIMVLAVGAWVLAGRGPRSLSLAANQLLVPCGLLVLYIVIPYLPYSSHVFRTLLTNQGPNFYVYYAGVFAVLAILIAVPVGALGATLPLLFKEGVDRAALLGRRVGIIYGANTMGCVIGAILGGYLALHYLNLDGVLRVCIGIAACTAILTGMRQRGVRRGILLTASVAVLSAIPLLSPWPRYAMGRGTFRSHEATPETYKGFAAFYQDSRERQNFEAYRDDPNSTIAVLSYRGSDASKSILVNGKSDGSTQGGDRVTTKLMAHLPGLLQTSTSDRAAVVGFGTGITVGSLALYDEIAHIDILEISQAVKEFSPLFDDANGRASKSPKVAWQLEDAYRFLIETPNTYAIIASEPSNPWVGGVERLYSRDFYELVKSKLAPGGVYAQWFHAYSISPETMAMVLRTFGSSFADVHLFERGSDIILIGANDVLNTEALGKMRERFQRGTLREDLADVEIESLDHLLKREAWIPWQGVSRAQLHTLDAPKLSYSAGRDFFFDKDAGLEAFAFSLPYKGWSKKSYHSTLLARLNQGGAKTEEVMSFALVACEVMTNPSLEWSKRSDRCKQALVALVVAGVVSSNELVTDSMVTLFRQLDPASKESPTPPTDIKELNRGLELVGEYGGPFIPIDAQKVRGFAQACFELSGEAATACRTRLALALATSGLIADAQEEFRGMLRDRLPLKSAEHAQSLADIVGVTLSEAERREMDRAGE